MANYSDAVQIKVVEISSITNSFLNEIAVIESELFEFLNLIDIDISELENNVFYDLEKTEYEEFCRAFSFKRQEYNSSCVFILGPVEIQHSYLIHTNRELDLMLKKIKPMAIFDHCHDNEYYGVFSQPFNSYVCENIKKITRTVHGSCESDFFVIKGNEWRVDAYVELSEAIVKMGYSPYFVWMEGKLLGYTEEQNTEFLKHQFDFNEKKIKEIDAVIRKRQREILISQGCP